MAKRADDVQRRFNPQALKRLELVNLLSKTGIVTVSNATVGNWIAAGCPRNSDGSLSLLMVFAWREVQHRKKEPGGASASRGELNQIQAKREAFKLARDQSEYLSREEVVEQFEEAATRMKSVLEAVELNHGPAIGQTIRAAIKKSFAGIQEMLHHAKYAD